MPVVLLSSYHYLMWLALIGIIANTLYSLSLVLL